MIPYDQDADNYWDEYAGWVRLTPEEKQAFNAWDYFVKNLPTTTNHND